MKQAGQPKNPITWVLINELGNQITHRIPEFREAADHFGHNFLSESLCSKFNARRVDELKAVLIPEHVNIFMGTISTMKFLRKNAEMPFTWCLGPERFFDMSYLQRLPDDVQEKTFNIDPYGGGSVFLTKAQLDAEFLDRFDELALKSRTGNRRVFARSDSGWKQLSGGVYDPHQLMLTLEQRVQDGDVCRDTKLLLSQEYSVGDECRALVNGVNGKVVGGSMYRLDGKLDELPGIPSAAKKEAEAFHAHLSTIGPTPPLYYIDLCRQPGDKNNEQWYVLELSCLHTAGMYAADPWPLVETADWLHGMNRLQPAD